MPLDTLPVQHERHVDTGHALASPACMCSAAGGDKPRMQHPPPRSPQAGAWGAIIPHGDRQGLGSRPKGTAHMAGCVPCTQLNPAALPRPPSLQPYPWDLCLWPGNPLARLQDCH